MTDPRPSAIPLSSLRTLPWHFGNPRWYRRVAEGLYRHPCGDDPNTYSAKGRTVVCYVPTPRGRKGAKAPLVPEGMTYPMREHAGPYAFPQNAAAQLMHVTVLAGIGLRRSVGRTLHPALWIVTRQLLVIAPLVAIAGAAGQALLAIQAVVIGALVRIPYQTFRVRLWILAYHQRACPDPTTFRPRRAADLAGGLAATVEALPLVLLGAVLWLVASSSTRDLIPFYLSIVAALVSTSLVGTAAAPWITDIYFNNRPDVRHVLVMGSSFLLAVGMLLYSPLSIISLPSWASTALDFVPWTALLFLPLKVGAASPTWLGLAFSALVVIVVSALLWHLGRNARTSPVRWQPGFDDDFDDDSDDAGA